MGGGGEVVVVAEKEESGEEKRRSERGRGEVENEKRGRWSEKRRKKTSLFSFAACLSTELRIITTRADVACTLPNFSGSHARVEKERESWLLREAGGIKEEEKRAIDCSLAHSVSVLSLSSFSPHLAVQKLLRHAGGEAVVCIVVGGALAGPRRIGAARREERRRRSGRRADDDGARRCSRR